MEVCTAWVKPPSQIGGLDHLGVQAPCINLYGRMVPGITNVTDRARYYVLTPGSYGPRNKNAIQNSMILL